jgi:carbonic anhydrase
MPGELGKAIAAFKNAIGDVQLPIDITVEDERDTDDFFYRDGGFSILNNGHTLQAIPENDEENYIVVEGARYRLVQFHFHTPSEHALSRAHTPMEIHFVHTGDEERLTVVGLFIDEGAWNEANTGWRARSRYGGLRA